jgi:hypothetical protein
MSMPIEKLKALSACSETHTFDIPLVYVKNKTLMSLNASNRMCFQQRKNIKDKFKKTIEPVINSLKRFKSGHVHFVYQIYFSDKRSRDLDNMIYMTKWLQDSIVEKGLLDDDKYVSYTMLPAISDTKLKEHKCNVTIIVLTGDDNYYSSIKDKENKK